jgi:hypothetical protein
MQNVPVILVLPAALTVYLTLDTAVILQTGKTPGLFYKFLRYRQRYGPITRKGRPRLYWSYIFGNVTVFGAVYRVRRLVFIFAGNPERCDSLVSGFTLSTPLRVAIECNRVMTSTDFKFYNIFVDSMVSVRPPTTAIRFRRFLHSSPLSSSNSQALSPGKRGEHHADLSGLLNW